MEELELCLKALKAGRACGPDQIPVEAYRGSESAKNDLFEFIKQCWREERLPTTLGRGTFITIFKKGRKDDYGNYRLINLLNHSYKVLSSLLLLRLLKETTDYFSESQAGFRKGRSCRDNIMILAQVIDFVLDEKRVHKLRKEQSQRDIPKERSNGSNSRNNRVLRT